MTTGRPRIYDRSSRQMPIRPMLATELHRFMSKVSVEPNTGCWLWLGHVKPDGYGMFCLGGMHSAHRVSFVHFHGDVPDGAEIDHRCRQRCCVNPDHLEAVTREENIRRAVGYRRHPESCPQGHRYSGDNLIIKKNGTRRCRACHNAQLRALRERRSEVQP